MMSVLWSVYLAVTLVSHVRCSLSPENEVPLHTATWLSDGKNTPVHLIKGHTHRFHFTLRKTTPALTLTVSPCSGRVEWRLSAHSLKDKPVQEHYWSFKKSEPEVWWRKSASEKTLHSYSGSSVETFTAPALPPVCVYALPLVCVYTLRITATQHDTHAHVYLHAGIARPGAFPELPFQPRVHVLGIGMSSVTLTWSPSPSVIKSLHTHAHTHTHTRPYEYCVTVNCKHNYRSLCAAQEEKGGMKDEWKKTKMGNILSERVCVCEEVESVCTVSDLQPNTLYYFDVFVMDRINSTSAAYTGAVTRTHAQSHADPHAPPHAGGVSPLREGRAQRVTLGSGTGGERRSFRFRPRGGQKNGLLTLLSCNDTHTLTHTLSVSVSARGNELTSQEVGNQLVQVWLQGHASYLIQLRLSPRHTPAAQRETVCVKMQAASAFHRRGAPALPHTLRIKSFNTLRTCSSVTLAWMGTEERGLYCLYRRRAEDSGETGGQGDTPPRQRAKNGADGEIQGRRESKTRPDEVTRGRRESKTGAEGEIQGRRESKTGPDEVTWGRRESKTGAEGEIQGRRERKTRAEGEIQGRRESKTGAEGEIQGRRESKTGAEGEIQGRRESKTGAEGEIQGRRESKTGAEGEIQGRRESKTGAEGEIQGRRESKTGAEGEIQGRRESKTGAEGEIQGRRESKTGAEGEIQGRFKSEMGGGTQDGQMRDTDGNRGIQDRQNCERVRWSETDQETVMCSEQKSGKREIPGERRSETERCLAPESRPPDQRVLCKYFQELDTRRAVTTATNAGLEPDTRYIFDIYLMRRWALPVKYHSKMVRTRRDC